MRVKTIVMFTPSVEISHKIGTNKVKLSSGQSEMEELQK